MSLLPACCRLPQATNDALTNTAARINALTRALPDQPALSAITNDITTRLSGAADALSAIAPALTAPNSASSAAPGLLRSQLASVNTVLEGVLRDVQSQEGNAPALADALAAGPLGQAAQVLGDVTKGLSDQIQVGMEWHMTPETLGYFQYCQFDSTESDKVPSVTHD